MMQVVANVSLRVSQLSSGMTLRGVRPLGPRFPRSATGMDSPSAAGDSATQHMRILLLRRKVFLVCYLLTTLTLTLTDASIDRKSRFEQCACAEVCAYAKVFRHEIVENI